MLLPWRQPIFNSDLLQVNFEQYILAMYLIELCIVKYNMVHFPPLRIAAAAFCLSLKLLNGCKLVSCACQATSYFVTQCACAAA